MRTIHNGRKQRVYLSASQRRALANTLYQVRCNQCNRQRLIADDGYRAISCMSCGWWANLGQDVFVSFAQVDRSGNTVTRVHKIWITPENVMYTNPYC